MAELNLSEFRAGIISKFQAEVRDQVSKPSVFMERFYYVKSEKARTPQYIHKPFARTDGRLSVVVPVAYKAEKITKVGEALAEFSKEAPPRLALNGSGKVLRNISKMKWKKMRKTVSK